MGAARPLLEALGKQGGVPRRTAASVSFSVNAAAFILHSSRCDSSHDDVDHMSHSADWAESIHVV